MSETRQFSYQTEGWLDAFAYKVGLICRNLLFDSDGIAITKRIAIVGAGFIGKSVIRNQLSKGNAVSVIDRHACPEEFSRTVKWIPGDYHELDSLQQALHGACVAYLLAASTVPGDLHVNPATELNDNVVGALRFIDTCLLSGVKRIVFASSSSVYGTQERLPISESAPTNPISAHGIHKLAVEKFLLLARHLHGIEVRILRIGNPYGPEQSLKGRQGFVAIAIGDVLRDSALPLRDKGRAIRDFVYIDDVAEALTMAGLMDGLPNIINVATGKGHSLSEVLALIECHTGRPVNTRAEESRIVDIPSSVLDIGLAGKVMNYVPRHEFSDGIRMTLQFHGIPILNDPSACSLA